MKELIIDAVELGYVPLFYTKRGTINTVAKKLRKLVKDHVERLELAHLKGWIRENDGYNLEVIPYQGDWSYNVVETKFGRNVDGIIDVSQFNYKEYDEAKLKGLKQIIKLINKTQEL